MTKYHIYHENEIEISREEAESGMSVAEVGRAYDEKINERGVEGDCAVACKDRAEMMAKTFTSAPYSLGGKKRIDVAAGVELDEDDNGNVENINYNFAALEI